MLIDTCELHRLLELWSACMRSREIGSVGASWSVEQSSRGHDPQEFTKEVDDMERAVARTMAQRVEWRRILRRYWLNRRTCYMISLHTNVPEIVVRRQLSDAEARVGEHYCNIQKDGLKFHLSHLGITAS